MYDSRRTRIAKLSAGLLQLFRETVSDSNSVAHENDFVNDRQLEATASPLAAQEIERTKRYPQRGAGPVFDVSFRSSREQLGCFRLSWIPYDKWASTSVNYYTDSTSIATPSGLFVPSNAISVEDPLTLIPFFQTSFDIRGLCRWRSLEG